jgi:hypothetical protein
LALSFLAACLDAGKGAIAGPLNGRDDLRGKLLSVRWNDDAYFEPSYFVSK